MIDHALSFALGATSLALLLNLWRLVRGPSVIDRVLAVDTMVINMITEFSVYRFIVFRKDMYTNKEGQAELARQQAQE